MARLEERYASLRNIYPNLPVSLKEHQVTILEQIESGRDVVAQLPTGYEKSLIYTVYPLLLDQVNI